MPGNTQSQSRSTSSFYPRLPRVRPSGLLVRELACEQRSARRGAMERVGESEEASGKLQTGTRIRPRKQCAGDKCNRRRPGHELERVPVNEWECGGASVIEEKTLARCFHGEHGTGNCERDRKARKRSSSTALAPLIPTAHTVAEARRTLVRAPSDSNTHDRLLEYSL